MKSKVGLRLFCTVYLTKACTQSVDAQRGCLILDIANLAASAEVVCLQAGRNGPKNIIQHLWFKISTCCSSTEWDGVQNGHNCLKPYLCVKRDCCTLHLLQINRKVSKEFLRRITIRCMTHFARPYKHTHTHTEAQRRIGNNSFTDHHKYKCFKWLRAQCVCQWAHVPTENRPVHLLLDNVPKNLTPCSQCILLPLVSFCCHKNLSARLMSAVTAVFSWLRRPNLNIRRMI